MKYLLQLIIVLSMTSAPLWAQSIEQATASHQAFNRLRAENADDANLYTALHKCYEDYAKVIQAASPNTPSYSQAKRGLREIWPFLQNGAAYYSSRGNQKNALIFAQAFMDVPLMQAFQGETFIKSDYYPTMAYFAASGTYNAGDYDKAINYFREYLNTGDSKNRQNVFTYMAKSCMNIQNYDLAMSVLNEGTNFYPNDFKMISMAINSCIERNDNTNLQKFLTKALTIKPNDETLLNIQGKLYEETQEYQKALNIYNKMRQMKPNSLNIAQHIAINYYNLGVLHYNKASMENNESNAKKHTRQAKDYFSAAANTLETIVANEPSAKYMQALATAYSCMGDNSNLENTNQKLASIGAQTVASNSIPALINYSNNANIATTNYQQTADITGTSNRPNVKHSPNEAPLYSQYAKEYVETRIKKWQAKDAYETVAEYQARVTESNRNAKVKELLKQAETDYIKNYTARIQFDDMLLKPYDADHRAFLVESRYGELIVPVPRENNEAKVFESSWSGMQFKNPEFYINNDKLMLASLTFVTPTGNTYRYDRNKELDYTETVVNVSFDPINNDFFAANSQKNHSSGSRINRQEVTVGKAQSDVDINIPETKVKNESLYALIIANENYSMVSSVPFALNDGEAFAQYCEKTLGIPHKNVLLYKDASFGIMLNAMDKIQKLSDARNGDMEVIFYYAGHGIPDESSKDAFLLPIDSDGKQTQICCSLKDTYNKLGSLNARSVTVFLDACFSGAKRDGGMVAEARGVAIKPKATTPQGNMVVFSAVSNDETALPYEEKGHGMFTYFLLKKLQETKGDVTLKELGDYIRNKVKSESILINDKSQSPTVSASSSLGNNWHKMKLNNK